ncbi:hypothetical protein GCM10009680_37060 [Streptomyces yatensis]|uniref:Restriction endonuclease domain-containing protein n=1 Tax=Streptomyces yatensis TaxID=155177 RepID=A0ABN2HUT2_9ACTN
MDTQHPCHIVEARGEHRSEYFLGVLHVGDPDGSPALRRARGRLDDIEGIHVSAPQCLIEIVSISDNNHRWHWRLPVTASQNLKKSFAVLPPEMDSGGPVDRCCLAMSYFVEASTGASFHRDTKM